MLFGNNEPAIDIMYRQIMDTVLDLCTSHMVQLKTEQSKWELEVLKAEYVEFYIKFCRYSQSIESAA